MPAAQYDFTEETAIEQGATFEFGPMTYSDEDNLPYDLTGYTARMQVRSNKAAEDVDLELTTQNGRIILGGAAGTVRLVLDATTTAAIDWRRGVYDLELVDSEGEVTRLLEGSIEVSNEVTKVNQL